MSDTRIQKETVNVCLFIDGTFTTNNPEQQSLLGKIMVKPAYGKEGNHIVNFFENCEEEIKAYYKGPGSDVFNDDDKRSGVKKLFSTLLGCVNGHWSNTSVVNSAAECIKLIRETCAKARAEGKEVWKTDILCIWP